MFLPCAKNLSYVFMCRLCKALFFGKKENEDVCAKNGNNCNNNIIIIIIIIIIVELLFYFSYSTWLAKYFSSIFYVFYPTLLA